MQIRKNDGQVMYEAEFRAYQKANGGPTWDTTTTEVLTALGADVSQGSGSRVRVKLNDVRGYFHEPHPEKETDKGAVKSVREFLIKAVIEP